MMLTSVGVEFSLANKLSNNLNSLPFLDEKHVSETINSLLVNV